MKVGQWMLTRNTVNAYSEAGLPAAPYSRIFSEGRSMIKNRRVAEQISKLMLETGAGIDDSIGLVKDQCTEKEFQSYRKAAGRVMGEILLEILNPIFKEHPELKPKELYVP